MMFRRLIDFYFDRKTRKYREKLESIDWQRLYERIESEIEDYSVFLETRPGPLVSIDSHKNSKQKQGIVGIAITYIGDKVPPWETEIPAKKNGSKAVSIS